jgi:hypothetical protein
MFSILKAIVLYQLVQGGQLYLVFPFSRESLVAVTAFDANNIIDCLKHAAAAVAAVAARQQWHQWAVI